MSEEQTEIVAPEVPQAVQDAADAIVEATPPETIESQPPQRPKKDAVQARIDELTREKYEERRRREALERQVQDLQSQFHQSRQQEVDDPQVLFQRQVQAEVERKLQERDHQQYNQTIQQKLESSVDKARQKYDDFDEKVTYSSISLPQPALEAIRASDIAGDLMYHVANDPAVVKQLNRMNPIEAVRFIGKLEAKIEPLVNGTVPVKKTATPPPPPINTMKGHSSPSAIPQKMSMDEYAQHFKQSYRR